MQFVGILTKDLLANSLTRRAPIPHTTFNLRMLGAEVNVPNEDQDPEVPAFEKLTQDSVFGVAGLDPDVEEALDDELPARSVEQGEHGLRKVDKWVMETHQERDRDGDVMLKEVRRRKRGKCKFCARKTSFFCPVCSSNSCGCPGRFWVCGPDVPYGRQCQSRHDSDWIFGNVEF